MKRLSVIFFGLILILSVAMGVPAPVFWYKADALSLGNTSPVATWTDSSVGAHDATASGTARPLFETNVLNSLPVVRFASASLQSMTVSATLLSTLPNTVIAVAKQTSKTTAGRFFDQTTTGSHRQLLGLAVTSGFAQFGNVTVLADGTDHSGGFHILTVVFNGSSTSTAYVDGVIVVSGSSGTQVGATSSFIGSDGSGTAANYLNGDIAELIGYSSALSDADRKTEEASLATKWGLSAPTPTATATASFTPCAATPTATATFTPSATASATFTPTPTSTVEASYLYSQ